MKKKYFVMLTVCVIVVNTPSVSAYTSLSYQTILHFSNSGPLPVSIFERIQNAEQLNSYCAANDFDTSNFSKRPDFDSVTVIALETKWGGGNKAFLRSIQRIIDDVDTIFVEIHRDTEVLDTNIRIELGYTVTLLSISKTGKPIIPRESAVTVAMKPMNRFPETRISKTRSPSFFDVRGRRLVGRSGPAHCMAIFAGIPDNGKIALIWNGRMQALAPRMR